MVYLIDKQDINWASLTENQCFGQGPPKPVETILDSEELRYEQHR